MIPRTKPRAPLHVVQSAALASWGQVDRGKFPEFYVAWFRGYYLDSMGKPGVNDRGIYDDACFVVGPDVFVSFRASVDPSSHKKGVASLIPGWYLYRPGNHGVSRPGGGYPAFRPATRGEALPVTRDGEQGRSKRDGVAMNIHSGALRHTSSDGCLTIYKPEWAAYHALVSMELKRLKLKEFWVGLMDGPII